MPTETYSFDRYLNVRSAYSPSFSPDGQSLSFLTDITGVAEVWRVPVDVHAPQPAWPTQLTFRNERVAEASYSPVENTLLITADVGGNELTQLYTLSGDGSTFTALTSQPDVIYTSVQWSPDGQRIIYSSNERDRRYFDIYERYLPDGQTTCILTNDGTNYARGYSPDGRQVLFARAESNVRNQLFLLDIASGETRSLTPALASLPALHGYYGYAAWSADRKGLYLLSNRERQFASLAWLDLTTNALIYLRDESWDAELLKLTDDGTRMALTTNEDGYSRLELFDVSAGWEARQPLPIPESTLPRGVVREITWSQDGKRLALTLDIADDATDVWVWDIAERALWRATRSATGGIPRQTFVAPSLLHYPTFDGRQVPAFLFSPRHEQARDLPVVVYVHGGPESQSRPNFNAVIQYLVSCGYAVFVPNVRGSSGYGYEYQSLDDVRLRMDSVADLQHAVFYLRDSGLADPRRIAVMGGSYGGFMVLSALTTYPDLWAAGVDIVGIANFVTFLENTGPWRRKLREAEYGSLEHDREFLEQISPIRSVNRITAPLFVVHGANDPRVPVGEAEQVVSALRERQVPVEYLRFEDEGHGLVKRANRLVAYPAIARFLDEHVRNRH
ncbi:MAG: alpha/beta fold hydrolase [Ktedonobacteraceae bacterium]